MGAYPWWKHALIAALIVLGLVYATPNFFGSDPALQITPGRGATVDAARIDALRAALTLAGLAPKSTALQGDEALLRFHTPEDQIKAQEVVRAELGPAYTVALNLAPAAPRWFEAIGARPMYLGLDLRGGVHFLMQVDTASAVRNGEERVVDDLRVLLRDGKWYYRAVRRFSAGKDDSGVQVELRDAAQRADAARRIGREHPELLVETPDSPPELIRLRLAPRYRDDARKLALQQNITTLRNRVNELGVAEPIIQQQGDSRIIVQLPGVQDTARAKEVLGATATLEFKLVDEEHMADAGAGTGIAPPGSRFYEQRSGGRILLRDHAILTGEYITDAASGFDQQSGGPMVHVSLDGKGAALFERVTGENIGKRLAVVFIESKSETVKGPDGRPERRSLKVEEVITAPVIRDRLGRRFQITGMDSPREARDLALLLRAGALAAPLEIIEERTVGPSLGQDNIDRGVRSTLFGFLLVVAAMLLWYRGYGVVANIGVMANLLLLLAVMSLLQATLTLPGIAGIVLTVGMAVDANVLIFERVREELRNGNSPVASVHAGYDRAFGTILDSNLTTLLVGVVLFIFGTGPVKGFAVTLSVGIATSMFTALTVTRSILHLSQRAPTRGRSRRPLARGA